MAAPAGFSDLINRKYDILQQEATDRGSLEQAQAGNITASTPFENALRAAQAGQANATTRTIQPLANASMAATYAGVGETNARAQLTGAQTGLVGAQTQDLTADLGAIGPMGANYYLNQLRKMGSAPAVGAPLSNTPAGGVNGGVNGGPAPVSYSPTGKIAPATMPNGQGQAGHFDENGNWILGLARGTANVKQEDDMAGFKKAAPMKKGMPFGGAGKAAGKLPGRGMPLAAAKGANRVPGKGSGRVDTVPAMLAPGEAVVNKAGVKHLPGGRAAIAKANAKGNQETDAKPPMKNKPPMKGKMPGFASGTDYVPAPGQTVTNGSWEGPTSAPAAPSGPPVFFPVPSTPTPVRTFGKRSA